MMIDGSALPFDENVELTRAVVKYAHARGVSVEGELGVLAGVEDDVLSANSTYTNPMKAVEFFREDRLRCPGDFLPAPNARCFQRQRCSSAPGDSDCN